MKRTAGFSLLEALVALAIAGLALGAVFELQHQLVNGQRRFDAALERAEMRRNALVLIRDLNPDLTPEGEMPLPPSHLVRWTSAPLTEQQLSNSFPDGEGVFYVTLYRLSVEVIGPEGVIDTFDVERMGWTHQDQLAAPL